MMTLAFDFNGYPKPATGTILSTCANTSETIELGYVRVEMTLSPKVSALLPEHLEPHSAKTHPDWAVAQCIEGVVQPE